MKDDTVILRNVDKRTYIMSTSKEKKEIKKVKRYSLVDYIPSIHSSKVKANRWGISTIFVLENKRGYTMPELAHKWATLQSVYISDSNDVGMYGVAISYEHHLVKLILSI
jgi:hypothetical protein